MTKLGGEVEVDESYHRTARPAIMHMDQRRRRLAEVRLARGGIRIRPWSFGLLERGAKKARVKVVNTPKEGRTSEVRLRENVEAGRGYLTRMSCKSYRRASA